MTLEEVYFVSQIVAVFAVIGSLVFVGSQVKANSRAVRAATAQAVHDNYAELYYSLQGNADLLANSLKAFTDLGSLSRLEKAQSVCTYMGYLAHGQNAFYQRREGHLSDSLWRGFESLLMMVMHTPGGAALWAERSYVFGQEFEDHIGDLMRRTPDPLARPRGVITPDFARAGEPSTPAVDQ